jgi:hypothetical protein
MSPGETLVDGDGTMVDQRMRRHAVAALRRQGHEVVAATASSLTARGTDGRTVATNLYTEKI